MSRPRPLRRRIHGIRGWLALAALLGLVAMHGLSMHGAGATEASMVGAHDAHAGLEMSAAPGADPGDPGSAGRGDAGQGHHHLMLMGLCLAVLAGAATAYALVRRRLPGGWTPRSTSYAASAAAPAARRFRDPPCLYRLSVQRC